MSTDLIGGVLLVLASIVVTPVILSYLSSESYGFWMTILQTIGLLGVLEAGTAIAVIRRVADPALASDREALSRLMSSSLLVQVLIGLMILAVGLGLSGKLLVLFGMQEETSPGVTTAFTTMVVWFAIGIPLGLIPAVLTGRQEIGLANGITSGIQLAAILGVIPFLAIGLGLMAFPLAQIAAGVMGAGAAYYCVRTYTPPFEIRLQHINVEDLKYICTFSGYSWIGKVAFLIFTSTDNIIITATLGAAVVTPYVLTSKLAGMIAPMVARLASSSLAGLSEMFAFKDYERLQRVSFNMIRLCVRMACFGGALVVFCTDRFVDLWVGPEHYGGMVLASVLGLITFRDIVVRPISVIIIASGDVRAFVIIAVIEALGKLLLSLVFVTIFKLGLVGIALGQLIATSIISPWYFPKKICELVNLAKGTCLIEGFIKPSLQCIPSIVALMLLASAVPTSWGWFGLSIIVLGSGLLNMATFEMPRILMAPHSTWTEKWRCALECYRV